jgi:C4-dicarboxylate transporter DctM subunit
MGLVLGLGFAVFLIIGLPIGVGLGLSSMLGMITAAGIPLEVGAQRLASGMRNFSLIAIPLYVLAGSLMNESGITRRLVDFAYSLVGSIRGGLGHVTCLTTAIIGGISGSQVADTSSVGKLMIPNMVRHGYQRLDAVSLMATAGAMFVTIPPSINLIVYGVLAQASIADLFFYGLFIGIGVLLLLMGMSWVLAIRRKIPTEKRVPVKTMFVSMYRAIPSLLIPIFVLGGIRLSIYTPTEGGAVAVLIALIVGFFVHRELTPRKLVKVLVESGIVVGVIMVVIAMAQMYSWALVKGQIPQAISSALLGLSDNKYVILIIINILMLIVGAVMEGNAALIVFVPLLLPAAVALGIDPVHLGLIMVVNLGIGLLTPPVGLCLLISCKIGEVTVSSAIRAMLPWFGGAIFALLSVTYVPLLFGWF